MSDAVFLTWMLRLLNLSLAVALTWYGVKDYRLPCHRRLREKIFLALSAAAGLYWILISFVLIYRMVVYPSTAFMLHSNVDDYVRGGQTLLLSVLMLNLITQYRSRK